MASTKIEHTLGFSERDKIFSSTSRRFSRRRYRSARRVTRAARLARGEVRVDGPVSGMCRLNGVKGRAAVCKSAVERSAGETFVRIFGCIPTVGGARGRPVQTRGGAVSEATAITELVVVEALRMFNSLCEAMGEPPSDMPGVKNRNRGKKALELSKPLISENSKMRLYQT